MWNTQVTTRLQRKVHALPLVEAPGAKSQQAKRPYGEWLRNPAPPIWDGWNPRNKEK